MLALRLPAVLVLHRLAALAVACATFPASTHEPAARPAPGSHAWIIRWERLCLPKRARHTAGLGDRTGGTTRSGARAGTSGGRAWSRWRGCRATARRRGPRASTAQGTWSCTARWRRAAGRCGTGRGMNR